MIASLQHTIERTTATLDQLGAMWGREITVSVSIHGLTHEQVHELGGTPSVYPDECDRNGGYFIATRLTTPMGWSFCVFGQADPEFCDQCRTLLRQADEVAELIQVAGLTGVGL